MTLEDNDMILEKPDNLVDHFEQATAKYKSNRLFGTKNKQSGEYEWITYEDVAKRVNNFRGGLSSVGVKKNDAVGIIANNRVDWAVAAFATYGLAARFVPMYESEIFKTWKYIIADAGITFLLVSSTRIYEEVAPLLDEIPLLKHIYIIEDDGEQSMKHLEEVGEEKPVPSVQPNVNDVAALIYTSGTTNDPKGVLLTHGNFVSNARAGYRTYINHFNEGTVSLSILPWAHSYGQTAELYNWLFFGGSIGFAESVETIGSDLAKVRPTFLIAVPRIFNKIYTGIHAKMNEEGGLKKSLFDMALKAAKEDRENNGNVGLATKLKLAIGRKLVFEKIRAKFGGRIVASVTGSAKMNTEISNFYTDIGQPVYDCYGLSETSPAITMNSPENNRQGSVGKPLEFVEVRIDKTLIDDKTEDGEIQVKGPNLMVGYHNKPEITKQVFTEDGWLKTGDRGRLDEDGYLFVTGRLKEQFKLENGKYVFPSAIEEDITLLPYIETAMIYGDGKPFNVCVVVPDQAILKKTAAVLEMKTDVNKLIHLPLVQEFMSLEIRKSLKGKYGSYEIPKKFIFTDEHFTIANGMLTQTLKLKRRVVLEKYKAQIDALYAD